MPERPQPAPEPDSAHDVLAAEEFAVPAPDPALHREPAHDVLAAEEFEVPAPDPAIHHGPVVLPGDLTGAQEPRDVLAAEEFAMPAPPPSARGHAHLPEADEFGPATLARRQSGLLPALLVAGIGLALARARRARRR
jgi:hypothetical protein